MPIRFRCVYCDKLLGIARRKAASVVSCPHCGEKLIVPTPEEEPEPPGTEAGEIPKKETQEEAVFAPANSGGQLFERSDFEALLQPEPTYRNNEPEEAAPAPDKPKAKPKPNRASSAPLPPSRPAYPGSDDLLPLAPIPLDDAPQRDRPAEGIVLSRSRAVWLGVIAVIALSATFAVGVVVGTMMK